MTEPRPLGQTAGEKRLRTGVGRGVAGVALAGFVGVAGLVALFGGFFTVDERERAVVTRNGKFQYVAGPGLHLKLPFVDTAHEYHVGMQSLAINDAETYTVDSQVLLVDMVIQYEIPDTSVERIFRELKNPEQRLASMALDRMKRTLGGRNAWEVPAKRAEVAQQVLASVKAEAERLYGLNIIDIQLPDISYTAGFKAAVESAARERAEGDRKINEQRRIAIELQIEQDRARSAAIVAEENAKGAAKARELAAAAEANSIRLKGEAEAAAIKAQSEALSNNPNLVALRQAERWNGQLPQQILGSAPVPILNMDGRAPFAASR